MNIEPLEARIAPATLVGNVLTFTDLDGDLVKINFTHAALTQANFTFSNGFHNLDTATPQLLVAIDLKTQTGAGFTATAKPHADAMGTIKGDSHVNIQTIDGTATDLGAISVDGNVGVIKAGTGNAGAVGLKSFTALSMGRDMGGASVSTVKNAGAINIKADLVNEKLTITGNATSVTIGGNVEETINGLAAGVLISGNVGTLKIGGSVIGRSSGTRNIVIGGTIGSLSIGGSLVGGSATITDSASSLGQVWLGGSVKTLHVGGDLVGKGGNYGGSIHVSGHASAITIGGSVAGGAGTFTGFLQLAGGADTITVGGSLVGAAGGSSGAISGNAVFGSVKISGSVNGAASNSSGSIRGFSFKSVSIGRDLVGGSATGNATIFDSGVIQATSGDLGSVNIGGDFIGGRVTGSGDLKESAEISALGKIGSIKIGGGIEGDPAHLAYILAGGGGTTGAVNAIGSITVKGGVQSASIVTGYVPNMGLFTAVKTDSGIGSVSIGGNLSGSFITVGSDQGDDNAPGTDDDNAISEIATVGSVKIGGAFTGLAGVAKTFYIYGPKIKQVTIGHATYTHEDTTAAVRFESIGSAAIKSAV